ncbi:MAG: hypothetical protein A3D92_18500 [Bacteroidetes bacterium RIFCSPHIGHO2_02_FULL_44_7]|nr:MAG: hypothetical protein A3D92_18500 [Bacteroidetes bacterium RIFCSPHIGHO2_02_FULL_44_7]
MLGAFVLSQFSYEWEKGAKQWLYVSVVLSSISVFYWSFFRLIETLPKEALAVSFAVAGVWGIVLAVAPLIVSRHFSRIPSLIFFAFYNLQFWRYVSEGGRYHLSYPLLSLVAVMIIIAVVLATYYRSESEVSQEFRKNAVICILALASVTVLMYGVEILRDPSRSIYWTVYGVLLLLLGLYKNDKYARGFGIGVLVFMIGKIYIIDVWRWETWIRFVALAVLGIALIAVSFLYQKRFKHKSNP